MSIDATQTNKILSTATLSASDFLRFLSMVGAAPCGEGVRSDCIG